MSARVAAWGFIVAVFVLHGVVAYLAPIASDDWDMLIWVVQHRRDSTSDWIVNFFAKHYTLPDLTHFAIARHPIVHAVLTPLLGLAAVWGTFVLANRRLPKLDVWADVVGLVVIASLIWIAIPRCGLTYFHRPYAGYWLVGTVVTVWFLVPYRCGWRPRGGWIALVVLAGFLAGSSTRQLGMLATLATAYAISKTPRPERQAWMWIAHAAVLIGTAFGFYRAQFDFRGLRAGFEPSLVQLNLGIYEAGELISLVGGLVIAKIVVGQLWPQHAGERRPDTTGALAIFCVWLVYIIVALLGPRFSEGSLFPAGVMIVVAVVPTVTWVMTSKPMRVVVIVLAVAINVIAWAKALSKYVDLNAQYKERVATLRAAPRRSVPTVQTYNQIRPEFWAYGEDWQDAARRQYVATALFKLSDVALSPTFRRLEFNPQLEIHLEAEGVTPEQLTAAGAPDVWPTTLKTARVVFDDVVARLSVKTPYSMRLVVDRLQFDMLRGRPLLAAAHDGGRTTTLRIRRRAPDDESKQAIHVTPPSFASKHGEAYTVIGGRATPVPFERRRYYKVQTLTTQLHTVVACDPQRCFLVDAFIPAL